MMIDILGLSHPNTIFFRIGSTSGKYIAKSISDFNLIVNEHNALDGNPQAFVDQAELEANIFGLNLWNTLSDVEKIGSVANSELSRRKPTLKYKG